MGATATASAMQSDYRTKNLLEGGEVGGCFFTETFWPENGVFTRANLIAFRVIDKLKIVHFTKGFKSLSRKRSLFI